MVLEEVLRERQIITNYLAELADLHERILFDPTRSFQLDKVRNDIEVCFEELALLNDSISGHHGEIRREVLNLEKWRDSFATLTNEELSLLRELKSWENIATDVSSEISKLQACPEPSSLRSVEIPLEITYKPLMDKYLQLAGPKAHEHTVSDGCGAEQDKEPTAERQNFVETLSTLELSHRYIREDITKLESLVKDLKQDKSFLTEEMRKQRSIMRNHKTLLGEKLKNVDRRKCDVLSAIGLRLPKNERKGRYLENSFLNISLSNQDENVIEREAECKEMLDLVNQYVAVKLGSLAEQLRNSKEEASMSVVRREIWSDCVGSVTQLESHLAKTLRIGTQQLSTKNILEAIQQCIESLDNLLDTCSDPTLARLITNEKKSLVFGCEGLPSTLNTSTESGLQPDQIHLNRKSNRCVIQGELQEIEHAGVLNKSKLQDRSRDNAQLKGGNNTK